MNRIRAVVSLLALATVQVCNAMAAGPREAPQYYVSPPPETPEERRTRMVAEMDVWLRRLVGRFRIEYPWALAIERPANAPRTVVDCVAIGAGPGVHCIYYMARPQAVPEGQADAGKKQQTPDKQLRPADVLVVSRIVEFGLDPNASKVRLMTVTRGSAESTSGRVSSNTLTSKGRCWDSPAVPPCEIGQRMMASVDSEDIWIIDYRNWYPRRAVRLAPHIAGRVRRSKRDDRRCSSHISQEWRRTAVATRCLLVITTRRC